MVNFDVDIIISKDINENDCIEIFFKGNTIKIETAQVIDYDYFVVDSCLVIAKCEDTEIFKVILVETIGDIINGILENINKH